jgi:hypothetical protein
LRGYYETDNEYIQAEFLKCMQEQRYGISEISEAEYKADYLEKKNQPEATQNASWREEWGKGRNLTSRSTPVSRLGSDAVAAAVGIKGVTDVPRNLGGTAMVDSQPTPASGIKESPTASRETFRPPTGKRPVAKDK